MMAKPWDDVPALEQELGEERRVLAQRENANYDGRVTDAGLYYASMSRQRARIARLEAAIAEAASLREAAAELEESHDPEYSDAA